MCWKQLLLKVKLAFEYIVAETVNYKSFTKYM